MPAPSPDKIVDTFQNRVSEHTRRFNALADLAGGKSRGQDFTPLQLRRGLAVDYFFRVATDWQVFQSEWSIKAIAHRPNKFLEEQNRKFSNEIKETVAAKQIALFTNAPIEIPSLGSELTAQKVRGIIDAKGQNLEFSTADHWNSWAIKNLTDPHKSNLLRILSNDGHGSLIDLTRQLRNHIAHRSSSSLNLIQKQVAGSVTPGGMGLTGSENSPIIAKRQNQIKDLGTYLDRGLGQPHGTTSQFISVRLNGISEMLRWK